MKPDLELALLSSLDTHPGANWRRVTSSLAGIEVSRTPDLLTALRELRAAGLVEENTC